LTHLGSAELQWKRTAVPRQLAQWIAEGVQPKDQGGNERSEAPLGERWIRGLGGVASQVLRTQAPRVATECRSWVDSRRCDGIDDALAHLYDPTRVPWPPVLGWLQTWAQGVQEAWKTECEFLSAYEPRFASVADAPIAPWVQRQVLHELQLYTLLMDHPDVDAAQDGAWHLFVLRHALGMSETLFLPRSPLESPDAVHRSVDELEVYKRQLLPHGRTRLWSNTSGELQPGACQAGFLQVIRPTKFASGYLGTHKVTDKEPPRDEVTLQPTKSREQGGGVGYGYMDHFAIHLNNGHAFWDERTSHSDRVVRYQCACGQSGWDSGTPEKPELHCSSCPTGENVVPMQTTAWAQNNQTHFMQHGLRWRSIPDRTQPLDYVPLHILNRPRA
jgi:hypothetical protein